MIPDEAVEAMYESLPGWVASYLDPETMRAALEAAAPPMLAEAFLRGLSVGYYVERGWTYAEALQRPIPEHLANPDEDSEEIPNPYRSRP